MAFARIIVILSIVCSASYLYAGPVSVPDGAKCDECGMSLDRNSKFISVVTGKDEKKLFFCDIGDMLNHFRSKKEKIESVSVRDFTTGEWIDGKSAFYVTNKALKTPMAWGIGAFTKESDAKQWGTPVDFENAFGLIKK
ncbi:MAG TPA: nitrous oxide reductase accessory protein NosL [Thermodesulfovibrionales bacterium]|nr:nitrous oxide reductase accessory protein NosL [Thermodesulfovibrionales bacterium]